MQVSLIVGETFLLRGFPRTGTRSLRRSRAVALGDSVHKEEGSVCTQSQRTDPRNPRNPRLGGSKHLEQNIFFSSPVLKVVIDVNHGEI